MFRQTNAFSGDLSQWNMASALDLSFMFYEATSLQTDMSAWNVAKVTTMEAFASAAGFLNTNIENWDISSCLNFDGMFGRGAGFRRNLCAWGYKIDPRATVSNMFGQSDSTSSQCPAPMDPKLTGFFPQGPFCHDCGQDGEPEQAGADEPPAEGSPESSEPAADTAEEASPNGGSGESDITANNPSSALALVTNHYHWKLMSVTLLTWIFF